MTRVALVSSAVATSSQVRVAGPGRGTACTTRWPRSRSLPSARARSLSSSGRGGGVGQILEQILDRVSLGQPVDQLDLLDCDRGLSGDRGGDLALLGVHPPAFGDPQSEESDQLVGGHQRQYCGRSGRVRPHSRAGQAAAAAVRRAISTPISCAVIGAGGAASGGQALHSSALPPAGSTTYSWHASTVSSRCARLATAGSRSSRRAASATARARSARPSTSASRRRVSWIQPRVLDRARHQGGGVHQEVRVGLGELAGRLGVQRDHADHGAGLVVQRHRDQRLVLLLLGLGHDLDARIGERVVAEEDRLVVGGNPPRQALTVLEPQSADQRSRTGRTPSAASASRRRGRRSR